MDRNQLILVSKITSVIFLIMVIFTPILSLGISLEWDKDKPNIAETDYSTTMLNFEIFDMRFRTVEYNSDTGEFDISRNSSINTVLTLVAILLTIIILITVVLMLLNFAVPAFYESTKVKVMAIIFNSILLLISLIILVSKRVIALISSLEIDRRGDLVFYGKISGFDLITTISFEFLFGFYMLLFGSLIGLVSLFIKEDEYEYEDDFEYDDEFDEEEEGFIQKIKNLFSGKTDAHDVKPRKLEQTSVSNNKLNTKQTVAELAVNDTNLSQIVNEAKLERLALIDVIAEAKKITGMVLTEDKGKIDNYQDKTEELANLEEKVENLSSELKKSNDQYTAVKEELAEIQTKIQLKKEELETIEKQKQTTLDLIVQSEIELTKLKVEKDKINAEINELKESKLDK